jgi:hypothetical protein
LKLGAFGNDIFDGDAIWPITFTGDILTGLVVRAWYEYRGGDDVKLFPRTKNNRAGTQIAGPERFDLQSAIAAGGSTCDWAIAKFETIDAMPTMAPTKLIDFPWRLLIGLSPQLDSATTRTSLTRDVAALKGREEVEAD